MRTLFEALQPHDSVFDRSKTDTVSKLAEIDTIDAEQFFAENFITEAMRTLLPEAFKRLEQREGAAGIFHLTQAMGGGKTHSLVALGLLARNQGLRPKVLGECGYSPG